MQSSVQQLAHSLQTPRRFSEFRLSKCAISSELSPQPHITTISTQHGASIANFCLKVLNYQLRLVICHLAKNAPQKTANLGSGSYGHVRKQSINQRLLAVKRQYFKTKIGPEEGQLANSYELMDILIEYAMTKICSFYQIGPEVDTKIGFDVLCYSDCAQFHLEMCQSASNYTSQRDMTQLNQTLELMHHLRIVHRDIKPDNIMYSTTLKRLVFVDFGLSHFVKQTEQSNLQSYTFFGGTRKFMCQKMLKLQGKGQGYVNLYQNDLVCLARSMMSLQSNNKNKIKNRLPSIKSSIKSDKFFEIIQDEEELNSRDLQFFQRMCGNQREIRFENQLNNYEYLKLLFSYSVDHKKQGMPDTTQCWRYLTKDQLEDILEMIISNCTKQRVERALEEISRSGLDMMVQSAKKLIGRLQEIHDLNQFYPEQSQLKNETEQSIKYRIRVQNYNDGILKLCREIKNPSKYIQSVIKFINIHGDMRYRYKILPVPPESDCRQAFWQTVLKFHQSYTNCTCSQEILVLIIQQMENLRLLKDDKNEKHIKQLRDFLEVFSFNLGCQQDQKALRQCATLVIKNYLQPGVHSSIQKLVFHMLISLCYQTDKIKNVVTYPYIPWNIVADMTFPELFLELFQLDNLSKGFLKEAQIIGFQLLKTYQNRLGGRHLCTLNQQLTLVYLLGSRGQYKKALEIEQSRFSSIRVIYSRQSVEMYESLLLLAWLHGKNNTGLEKKLHAIADRSYFYKPRSIYQQHKYLSCKLMLIVNGAQPQERLEDYLEKLKMCRLKLQDRWRFHWSRLIWCQLYLSNPNHATSKSMLLFFLPNQSSRKQFQIEEIWKKIKADKEFDTIQNMAILSNAGNTNYLQITDQSWRYQLLKRIIILQSILTWKSDYLHVCHMIQSLLQELEKLNSKTVYDYKQVLKTCSRLLIKKSRSRNIGYAIIPNLQRLLKIIEKQQLWEVGLSHRLGICEIMFWQSKGLDRLSNMINEIIGGYLSLKDNMEPTQYEAETIRCYHLLISVHLKLKQYQQAFSYVEVCDTIQVERIRYDFPHTVEGTYQMCRYLYATDFHDLADQLVNETIQHDRKLRWEVLKALNSKDSNHDSIRYVLPEFFSMHAMQQNQTMRLFGKYRQYCCPLFKAFLTLFMKNNMKFNNVCPLEEQPTDLSRYFGGVLHKEPSKFLNSVNQMITSLEELPGIHQSMYRAKSLISQWLGSYSNTKLLGLYTRLEMAYHMWKMGQAQTSIEQLQKLLEELDKLPDVNNNFNSLRKFIKSLLLIIKRSEKP